MIFVPLVFCLLIFSAMWPPPEVKVMSIYGRNQTNVFAFFFPQSPANLALRESASIVYEVAGTILLAPLFLF